MLYLQKRDPKITKKSNISHPLNLFLAKNHCVSPSPPLPPPLPHPHPTFPPLSERPEAEAQKGRGCQARHMALGLGTAEVEVPAGPFSSYKAVPTPPPFPNNTHTHTLCPTHTSGGRGKHTLAPLGEVRRRGLWFLRATLSFSISLPLFPSQFSTSSSSPSSPLPPRRLRPAHVIQQTVSCCITHTPLCPCVRRLKPCSLMWHQKLGHEHGTRRQGGRERMENAAKRCKIYPQRSLFVFISKQHQVDGCVCCCCCCCCFRVTSICPTHKLIKYWMSSKIINHW